jgi:hypothetical protein
MTLFLHLLLEDGELGKGRIRIDRLVFPGRLGLEALRLLRLAALVRPRSARLPLLSLLAARPIVAGRAIVRPRVAANFRGAAITPVVATVAWLPAVLALSIFARATFPLPLMASAVAIVLVAVLAASVGALVAAALIVLLAATGPPEQDVLFFRRRGFDNFGRYSGCGRF